MKETIDIVRQVFSEVGKKQVILPDRTIIDLNKTEDSILFMPAYIPNTGGLGIKIVTVFPENRLKNIPTISALLLLSDPDTGIITTIMDGGYITALRTGAVSGIATDILARRESKNLGIFGAGVQARSQIEAILEVREIDNVTIYDPIEEVSGNLVKTLDKEYGSSCFFQSAKSSEMVVENSDIIITATTSQIPVFDGSLLKDGTHINSIGSFQSFSREVDDVTIQRSGIFIDSYNCSLKEAGDLIIPLQKGIISENDIKADLGELILEKKKGRESENDITYFKSVGMAVQDIAVARVLEEKANDKGLGIILDNT